MHLWNNYNDWHHQKTALGLKINIREHWQKPLNYRHKFRNAFKAKSETVSNLNILHFVAPQCRMFRCDPDVPYDPDVPSISFCIFI